MVPLLGIGLALAAAGLWGLGDFSGGLGVRRGHPFRVLVLSTLSGIALLGFTLILFPEPWPSRSSLLWALLAGGTGSLGITALYTGLARGKAAVVAPTTAVGGALIPVLFGLFTQGLLSAPQLAGMAVALFGLWLVSALTDNTGRGSSGFVYGLLGGIGVSGFLIFIAQVNADSALWPLVIARVAGLTMGIVVLAISRAPRPRLLDNPWALTAGVLDAGGNLLYVFAVHHLRLDLAAVLSSLYPAVTVLLATWFLHQATSRRQWLGVALCLAGAGLISLSS